MENSLGVDIKNVSKVLNIVAENEYFKIESNKYPILEEEDQNVRD